MRAVLYLGASSWKFPSWRGLVYSDRASRPTLTEYAARFGCVEIDQWYWSLFDPDQPPVLPKPEVAAEYAASVPTHFRFGVKLPDALTLTHYRPRPGVPAAPPPNPYFLSADLLRLFLDRIAPMRPLLGPLMLQFGYLNRQMMASERAFRESLSRFLEKVPSDYTWAVECRNPAWLTPAFLDFLRERNTGFVALRGYYMPPFFDLLRQHLHRLPPNVILRLQAGGRADMERRSGGRWSRLIEPREAELDLVADTLRRLGDHGRTVWVFVNNHYEGSAPLTLARIQERLETT
jgi:uncharacterized protein YecE (DUF72 family)